MLVLSTAGGWLEHSKYLTVKNWQHLGKNFITARIGSNIYVKYCGDRL